MINPREVFDWLSHVSDNGAEFADDLADLVEDISEEVRTCVIVQTHSEEYARNRAVDKIKEIASVLRAFRVDQEP